MRCWPSVRSRWPDIGQVVFPYWSVNKNARQNEANIQLFWSTNLGQRRIYHRAKERIFFLGDQRGKSRVGKMSPSCSLQRLCSAGEIYRSQNTLSNQRKSDRRSKRAWPSSYALHSLLSGSPNKCWLHTCHICVIATWRLGVWAPIFSHNDRSTCNFKSNWFSELLFCAAEYS